LRAKERLLNEKKYKMSLANVSHDDLKKKKSTKESRKNRERRAAEDEIRKRVGSNTKS